MSTLRADLVSNLAGDGPAELFMQSAAKTWGSANEGGDTILDSFNVSSLNDAGTGLRYFTPSNAIKPGSVGIIAGANTTSNTSASGVHHADGTLRLYPWDPTASLIDKHATIISMGDLA